MNSHVVLEPQLPHQCRRLPLSSFLESWKHQLCVVRHLSNYYRSNSAHHVFPFPLYWHSLWKTPPFSSCRTTTPRVTLYQYAEPTTTHIKFHKPCQAIQLKSIHHTRNNCQHTPCYTSSMVQNTNLFILLSACSPHTHSAANLQIRKPHRWASMLKWLPLCNAYIIHGQKQWGECAPSKPYHNLQRIKSKFVVCIFYTGLAFVLEWMGWVEVGSRSQCSPPIAIQRVLSFWA